MSEKMAVSECMRPDGLEMAQKLGKLNCCICKRNWKTGKVTTTPASCFKFTKKIVRLKQIYLETIMPR